MSNDESPAVSPKIEFELMGLGYNDEAMALRERLYETTVHELGMDDPRGPAGRIMILRKSIELMAKLPAPPGSDLEKKEADAVRLVELLCDEERAPYNQEEQEALKHLLLRGLYGLMAAPELYKNQNPTTSGAGCGCLVFLAFPLTLCLGLLP